MTKKQKISMLISAFICVIFLTWAQISGSKYLIILSLVLYLALLMLSRKETTIPLILFFLPWSTLLKISPDSISFCSIGLLLIFVLYCLFKSNRKFDLSAMIPVFGIIAITLIATFTNDHTIVASYIMFVAMLVAYPLFIYWMRDSVDFETCTLYYSLGIISATVISLIFANNANLLAYIRVLDNNTSVVRYCGFYMDPNFFASQVVTAVGCQLLIINKKSGRQIWNAVLLLALIICGAISVSKSYLICVLLVLTVWLFCQIQKGMGKLVKVLFVASLLVVIVLSSGAFSDIIDQYLFRFGTVIDSSSLTTGRSELWSKYIKFLVKNPTDLLLGQGYINTFEDIGAGSHNTVIQCIYQLGLVGSAFFVWWFAAIIKAVKASKVRISTVLLLATGCFSMWMGLDMMFFDDLFLTIVIFALGLKYAQPQAEQADNLKDPIT